MMKFDVLVGLLGKPVDDAAVTAAIAKAGKVKVTKDSIVAKQAGFEYALERPDGAGNRTPKLLSTLFLTEPYAALPKPFVFGMDRQALLALGPEKGWKLGKWATKLDDPEIMRFYWTRDGVEFAADLRRDVASTYSVTLPAEATGGEDLSTNPLHFEAAPSDEPELAALVGMALLVAWATEKHGPAKKHAEAGKALAKRAITPRTFLVQHCKSTLTSLDVAPALVDFLSGYTNRMFIGDDHAARKATDKTIQKLLGLHRPDERAYTDDFLGTFKAAVANPYYVPDSWAAVDRIAPILDARWADYQKTRFEAAPDIALYEKAAKARDKVAVAPAKKAAAPSGGAVDARALIACIGKPLTDPDVKAAITAAGMPIGKKIDEQANPALGVSYLGDKAKGKMRCGDVTFYAAKQSSYIRGLGKEVIFDGFTGALPLGVALGDKRADVTKKLGKPAQSFGETDIWFPRKDRRISAIFAKKTGALIRLNFGFPADWVDPPEPPYGPSGVF